MKDETMESAERNRKFNRLYKDGLIQWENKFDDERIDQRWTLFETVTQKTVKDLSHGQGNAAD